MSDERPLDWTQKTMNRREFLRQAAAFWFSLMVPVKLFRRVAWAADAIAGPVASHWDRVLVLVELQGGNDGLNTVIPYTEDQYYEFRKKVAVPRDQVLHLSDRLGFHPSLQSLMPLWNQNEMAVVLGVGYPGPNRSHFRSSAIWETAADSDQYLGEGWLSRLFAENRVPSDFLAEGIVIGNSPAGPLSGASTRVITVEKPDSFWNASKGFERRSTAENENPALQNILDTQREIERAAGILGSRMNQKTSFVTKFPKHRIGQHLEAAARMIANRVPVPVIKVGQAGFDTHSGQYNRHGGLLRQLSDGLAAFRSALQETGDWNRVLVMTYSEFGRRARDNDSSGTDHGAAAPHFLMGGKVKGGFYGKQPSLTDLADGDLKYHVDYRSLYETIGADWWRLRPDFLPKRRYSTLPCISG